MRKRAFLDFLLLALRPLSKSPDIRDWWEIVQAILVLAGFTAVGILGDAIGKFVNASHWQARLILGVAFIVVLFLIAGSRLAYRIIKYESPELEIAFNPELPELRACEMRQMHRPASGVDELAWVLWRVAIRGPRGRSIHGIEVRLVSFEPQGAEFLPQALRPMRAQWVGADVLVPSTFQVDPGTTEFVDVVRWWPVYPKDRTFSIAYHLGHLPNSIPEGDYVFTIEAKADGTPRTERRFRLYMENGQGVFRMLSAQ